MRDSGNKFNGVGGEKPQPDERESPQDGQVC